MLPKTKCFCCRGFGVVNESVLKTDRCSCGGERLRSSNRLFFCSICHGLGFTIRFATERSICLLCNGRGEI